MARTKKKETAIIPILLLGGALAWWLSRKGVGQGIICPINDYAVIDNTSGSATGDAQRKLTRDANGRLWCAYSPGAGSVTEIFAAYSDDWGKTWTVEQVTNSGFTQEDPCILMDLANQPHIFWEGQGIRHTHRERTGLWVEEGPVPVTADNIGKPMAAIGPDGTLHLIVQYTETGYYRVGYMAKPLGGSWTSRETIFGSNAFSSGEAAMAVDRLGMVHAVAQIGSGGMLHELKYRTFIPGSVRWGATETIAPGFSPCIAIDHAGDIYVTYNFIHQEYPLDTGSIRFVKRTAGVWRQPLEIALIPNTNPNYGTGQIAPSIQIASDGVVSISWSGMGWEPNPGMHALMLSESLDKGATWSEPRVVVSIENQGAMSAQMMFASQPKSANPSGGFGILFQLDAMVAYALVSGKCLTV